MLTIFPFRLLEIVFLNFDDIQQVLNNIWLCQIFVCWLHCFRVKQILPNLRLKRNFYIKQFYVYMLVKSVCYTLEMASTNIFFDLHERFLHHLFAILLFASTYLKPHIISVCYLTPYLFHSIYWLTPGSKWADTILMLYNVSMLVFSIIIFVHTYNKRVKVYSLRVLLCTGLLYNVNLFGHFYGYNVKILELDTILALKALTYSALTSTPFYGYLIYVNVDFRRGNLGHSSEFLV